MNKEIVKTDPNQVPDFMKSARAGAGTEALSSGALSPPRLKLIQSTSPELEEISGIKPGDYFNSVSMESYGAMVSIIPCFLTEAYFLFAPRLPGSQGGLLARADDGVHWSPPDASFDVAVDKKGGKATWRTAATVMASGLAGWGTSDPHDKNSPPAATHAINCVVLATDRLNDGPAVLSFMRSGLKTGKKFAGNLRMSRVPAFGRVFELTSMKVEGPSGPYYEPRLRPAGFVQDQMLYKTAESIYNAAKMSGVKVDIGEEAPSDTGLGEDKIPY